MASETASGAASSSESASASILPLVAASASSAARGGGRLLLSVLVSSCKSSFLASAIVVWVEVGGGEVLEKRIFRERRETVVDDGVSVVDGMDSSLAEPLRFCGFCCRGIFWKGRVDWSCTIARGCVNCGGGRV